MFHHIACMIDQLIVDPTLLCTVRLHTTYLYGELRYQREKKGPLVRSTYMYVYSTRDAALADRQTPATCEERVCPPARCVCLLPRLLLLEYVVPRLSPVFFVLQTGSSRISALVWHFCHSDPSIWTDTLDPNKAVMSSPDGRHIQQVRSPVPRDRFVRTLLE